jgi:citronellol/citronellal dehydrogenase
MDSLSKHCRKPEIVADAAHVILTRPSRTATGNFYMGTFLSLLACCRC